MPDRHLLGDIALAVLIAFPAVALTRPEPVVNQQTSSTAPAQTIATADRPVSLLR